MRSPVRPATRATESVALADDSHEDAPKRGLERRIRSNLTTTATLLGDICKFSGRTLWQLPDVRKFSSEVLHQCYTLIVSSGLIIWFMQGVIGTMCGTEASYMLKQFGAPLYSGIFTDYCGFREMSPYMWAYIFAAKVGCGMVAELGAMRVGDEIDALEVMGINSRIYLLGTRLVASWIAIPFLFTVGLGVSFLTMYLVVVVLLGDVSPAGYDYIFWLYQNPLDFLYVQIRVIVCGTVVLFISSYYGFTARGGPVGVGKATAKAMLMNLLFIHFAGVMCTQLFWGQSPNAPIAN
jgi:phospholipid/cholesterol/gamma-HCH transport system permease protein